MGDLNLLDRTWLVSVLFFDIVLYSSLSVELQIQCKERFNSHLTDATRDLPENDRITLDTGDGAAICFLGSPETAMFTALKLLDSFVRDHRQQTGGLQVRMRINLGPIRLVKDVNGRLTPLGDGINDAQRIMNFAASNQILVSRSFLDVVSRLSDDYRGLFKLKGIERDKHVREHTVYHLSPPETGARLPVAPPIVLLFRNH